MNAGFSASSVRGNPSNVELAIGGLTPLSGVDFPGRLAAVIFCQGCPWRCGYCHNPHLLARTGRPSMWSEIRQFLKRRQGLLDGVVFSGGEPTLQRGLAGAAREVQALGFETGLHTAGPYPERLPALLPHLNWVGMDVKAPFDDYATVTGASRSGERARRSAHILVESRIDCEFRTTVDPRCLSARDILRIADELSAIGARRYVLQEARGQDRAWSAGPQGSESGCEIWTPRFTEALRQRFPEFLIRRAA
ncbi:MAG: anaerobic ribonucleoside-triphosphate reductase activating protein [Acidiferrobacteraceae bacterium]